MGSAQGEVDELDVTGCEPAAGGLGGQCRLESDLVEQVGLDQLRLSDGGGYLKQRLVGQDDSSFGDGMDVAGEPQGTELLDDVDREPCVLKPVKILGTEGEGFEVPETVLHPGGDEEPPIRRKAAHEQAKGRRANHAAL